MRMYRSLPIIWSRLMQFPFSYGFYYLVNSKLFDAIAIASIVRLTRYHTHMHGSPFMVRPRPFPGARKREASGGLPGTINSPKVCLKRCDIGPE